MKKIYFNLKSFENWINRDDCLLAGGWQQSSQGLVSTDKIYFAKLSSSTSDYIKKLLPPAKLQEFIKELGYFLDKINCTKYGDKWEIIIGPYVYLIWDLFIYSYYLLEKIKSEGHTIVIHENLNINKIDDYVSFNNILTNIDWQEGFINLLATELNVKKNIINFKSQINPNVFIKIHQPNFIIKNIIIYLKSLFTNLFKIILYKFFYRKKNSKILIVSIYGFGRFKKLLLSFFSSKSIFLSKNFTNINFPSRLVDYSTRGNIAILLSKKYWDDPVLKIFSKITLTYLPISYFESFSPIKNAVTNVNCFASGSITSYSHITSDFYKIWLVDRKLNNNNFKFGVIQHGGYGFSNPSIYSIISIHEANIADVLFKWGSGGLQKKDSLSVGVLGFKENIHLKFRINKRARKILFVVEEPPRGPQYAIDFTTWKSQLEDLAKLSIEFKKLSIDSVIRLYCNDTKQLQINILRDINPNIILDESDSWLKTLSINDFDSIIFTYLSSGYFQSILMGYPTLLFSKHQYSISDNYINLYNDMESNHLIFNSADSLLNMFKSINFDIYGWWHMGHISSIWLKIKENFAQPPLSIFQFGKEISRIFSK